jgi:large subunit ribosomal protein L22
VKSAIVDQGPVLKRFKAGARGTAMPRRKKMSHITIVLTDGNSN